MLKLGIDPEKLYRATFIRQYGLCCCNMALVSFRLFCKNLGHLREFFGQMVYRPPWQKIPRTPMVSTDISRLRQTSWTNMQPRKQTLHVKPSVETIAETWFSRKNYPMNEFSNSSGWWNVIAHRCMPFDFVDKLNAKGRKLFLGKYRTQTLTTQPLQPVCMRL